MASVLRTLTNFRDGVADVADVNIAASGVRHTHAIVDRRINAAVMRWVRLISECGDDTYTARYAVTTNPATGLNRYVDVAAAFMFLRLFELHDGEQPVMLLPMEQLEKAELYGGALDGEVTGFPLYYRLGPGMSGFAASHVIRIFPAADAVYSGTVTVVLPPPTLTAGTDAVEVIAGGDEWIINDAAIQTLRTTGMADAPAVQLLVAQNAKLEAELKFSAACRGHSGKVDTVGMRQRNAAFTETRRP